MKALIVYGTRYGATAGTALKIGVVLQKEGFDVKVVDLKEETIRSISSYELIIVGSGMQIGRWTGEAEDFLKSYHHEMGKKKVALFVSTMKTVSEREGKTDDLKKARKLDLEDKAVKYNLQPLGMGFFGGILDFNKMNLVTRKTFGFIKPQLEKDGIKETEPGVYDLRNWDEIIAWTKDLAKKAKE